MLVWSPCGTSWTSQDHESNTTTIPLYAWSHFSMDPRSVRSRSCGLLRTWMKEVSEVLCLKYQARDQENRVVSLCARGQEVDGEILNHMVLFFCGPNSKKCNFLLICGLLRIQRTEVTEVFILYLVFVLCGIKGTDYLHCSSNIECCTVVCCWGCIMSSEVLSSSYWVRVHYV